MDKALIIEKRGGLAEITLNRPDVLNALNDEMRAEIVAALPDFSSDPETYALIVRSNSPRAFCAGGDVRQLTELARSDIALAAASVRNEYLMNWSLECFTKPTISLMDGMVMGSGVGLMLYGTHRVAGEGFTFAMPETAIGLFPDVGVCTALSKMPGNFGHYLGLTGRAIGRADAYRLGLLTHCIKGDKFDTITAGIEAADTVDPILDGLHETPGDDELEARASLIEDIFSHGSVPAIFSALERHARSNGRDADWCAAVLADLRKRAPLSLFVTLRHLDECRNLQLRDVLVRDYRLAVRFLHANDLQEGVRAALIDKDGAPRWTHAGIDDVQPEEIDDYFKDLGEGELILPDREKMQESRG